MNNIFFIGIGGKGLNGIAKMCLEKGMRVSGVDTEEKPETVALSEMGAQIFIKHNESNISDDIDLIVYTSLIKNDCPEMICAHKLNIKTMKRAEFLAYLTRDDFRISISGSHGKSTTTALCGLSLLNSNIDASIFGGAHTREIGGYNHLGKTKYSVIEACEYDRSFFYLVGDISIITSVEKGHLEYYKNEKEMVSAFCEFANRHGAGSIIIANGDDSNVRFVTARTPAQVCYFGFDTRNEFVIGDVLQSQNGSIFSIFHNSKKILNNLEIKIPGTYNILNFVASAILLYKLGLSMEGVIETAKHFNGVGRRFEITRSISGPIFIDDFAHHPTQVKNLFEGIKQFFPDHTTCAVFQPRQYNLMKNFLKEYGESFQYAHEVILTDIVPGLGDTDADIASVNTADIISSIKRYSDRPVRVIETFSEIADYIKSRYGPESVVATIGAGDIYKVRDQFMKSD